MKITATLSEEFLLGAYDTQFVTDWNQLTSEEQATIANFMVDLGEGNPLKGKNKPSWVNDNYEKLRGSNGYEQEGYWHYHCGPGWYEGTFRGMTVNLAFNPQGMASNECIHYIKNSPDNITIVGYSRVHIPFPSSDFGINPFFPEDE